MSIFSRISVVAGAAIITSSLSTGHADVIYSESFNYAAGTSLTVGGTGNPGWVVQAFGSLNNQIYTVADGLNFTGVASSGGAAKLNTTLLLHNVPGIGTNSFYVSALFNKADNNGRLAVGFQTAQNGTYVAGFGLSGGGLLTAGDGKFNGTWVNAASSSVSAGTTAMLVAYVDVPNHTVSVWNVTDTTAALGTPVITYSFTSASIGAINITYTGNYTAKSNLIDELRVGTTLADVGIKPIPEPASLGLLAAGGLLIADMRRKH